MTDAAPHTAHWVKTDEDVDTLAELITDPQRTQLVVGVTTQPARQQPLVDADELAARLGDRAQVWVITEADHAWALTEELPDKIDVYGGAVRAWNPIPEDAHVYPSDHPQWTVFGPEDAERILTQLPEYAALADNPLPPFGTASKGVVTAVRQAGAELELESGHPAFASLDHLVQHGEVFHAGDVLTVGQKVTVRVGAWHAQAGRVSVSLREHAPDPWERIDEVYAPGHLIEVGVSGIAPFGAFVELLPGVEGLLHKSKIADAYVEYIEDYVQVGDRITVRLLSLEPQQRKAEVSLLHATPGEEPEPPASIFPGGPPWLPPRGGRDGETTDGAASADAPPSVGSAVPFAAELQALVSLVLTHGASADQALASAVRDAVERATMTFDAVLDEFDGSSDEPAAPLAALRDAAGALIDAARVEDDRPVDDDQPEDGYSPGDGDGDPSVEASDAG